MYKKSEIPKCDFIKASVTNHLILVLPKNIIKPVIDKSYTFKYDSLHQEILLGRY